MAGTPSMTNSHCQPFNPPNPPSPSRAPESGAPKTVEIGTAAMNSETMRARSRAGNQKVR
jgi:hypothetical protein